jgi:hypothetical protein
VARWSRPFALDAADFSLGGVRSTVVQRDLSRRAGYAGPRARVLMFRNIASRDDYEARVFCREK